jgi:Leucine-rich repeat (LRR) protein
MTFNIETYLNSLPEDTETIDISNRYLTFIPSLTMFKNLQTLICSNNQLTSLPDLNENLKKLSCINNQLTSLPHLNEKLEILYCFNNQLTSLPHLNEKLKILACEHNQLTSLPPLNEKLEKLWCYGNQLTSLPPLNENLKELYFSNNPINEIINGETTNEIKKQMQILNNFRHLYYSLKFKKQFRDWLWVKIREPKAMKKYNPSYLLENLQEYTELDSFLDNWL